MNQSIVSVFRVLTAVLVTTFVIGCSSRAAGPLVSGLVGAGLGAGVGAIIDGSSGAVIGGGAGAAAGALAAGLSSKAEQEDGYVIRKPHPVSAEQREIDVMRREMEDESILGGGEVRPWNERYNGSNANRPYQGPGSGYR